MSSASASEVVGTSQQTLRNHYSDHGEPGERIDKLTADAKGALTYIWKIQHEKEGLQKARSRAEHDEGEIMDIDAKLTKIEADIENKRKEIDEILKNVRELVHCFVAIQKKKDEITSALCSQRKQASTDNLQRSIGHLAAQDVFLYGHPRSLTARSLLRLVLSNPPTRRTGHLSA